MDNMAAEFDADARNYLVSMAFSRLMCDTHEGCGTSVNYCWDAEIFLNKQVMIKIRNLINNASPNNEICINISYFLPVWMKLCQSKQADLLFSASLPIRSFIPMIESNHRRSSPTVNNENWSKHCLSCQSKCCDNFNTDKLNRAKLHTCSYWEGKGLCTIVQLAWKIEHWKSV